MDMGCTGVHIDNVCTGVHIDMVCICVHIDIGCTDVQTAMVCIGVHRLHNPKGAKRVLCICLRCNLRLHYKQPIYYLLFPYPCWFNLIL